MNLDHSWSSSCQLFGPGTIVFFPKLLTLWTLSLRLTFPAADWSIVQTSSLSTMMNKGRAWIWLTSYQQYSSCALEQCQ